MKSKLYGLQSLRQSQRTTNPKKVGKFRKAEKMKRDKRMLESWQKKQLQSCQMVIRLARKPATDGT